MNDTPKKTLSLTRKPVSTDQAEPTRPATLTRGGKRIIRVDPAAKTNARGKPAGKANQGKNTSTRKTASKKPAVRPSDLKAKELNDRLNSFPIWLHYQPLAIGIEKDIFRLVGEEHFPGASKQVVQKVLKMHTSHGRYRERLAAGGERYRLDGATEGVVTREQQCHAQNG